MLQSESQLVKFKKMVASQLVSRVAIAVMLMVVADELVTGS